MRLLLSAADFKTNLLWGVLFDFCKFNDNLNFKDKLNFFSFSPHFSFSILKHLLKRQDNFLKLWLSKIKVRHSFKGISFQTQEMLVGERGQNLIIMTCRKTQLSPHYLEMYHYQIIGEIVEKLGILFHTFSCEKHLKTKSFMLDLSYLKKKLQNFPAKKLTLQLFFFFVNVMDTFTETPYVC